MKSDKSRLKRAAALPVLTSCRVPRDITFDLMFNDRFTGLLGLLGLGGTTLCAALRRIFVLVAVSWGLPALLAWFFQPAGLIPRQGFFHDLAAYSQFLGFLPLAMLAEVYIHIRLNQAVIHLHLVTTRRQLAPALDKAGRLSRLWWVDLLLVFTACTMTWMWARQELGNCLPSWHTQPRPEIVAVLNTPSAAKTAATAPGEIPREAVAAARCGRPVGLSAPFIRETLTPAGWAIIFSLVLFTYLWLRWVWKIAIWSRFLHRVSKLPLALIAAHPDHTGGIGCLTLVQRSFALLLFATGILFSTATWYKVRLEGTPLTDYTVWVPIVGYILLAPSVFLAPLFLFTRQLAELKREALLRYTRLGQVLVQAFERRWCAEPENEADRLLVHNGASSMTDFRTSFEHVAGMRVVPFDWQSVRQLFGSAAGPFLPPVFDWLHIPEVAGNLLKAWLGLA